MTVVKLEQSPFPPGWWGSSLDKVGLKDQRPDVGTYGRYVQSSLPALPVPLDGKFSWLRDAGIHDWNIGDEWQEENRLALPKLEEACAAKDVALPDSFLKFFATPELHAHIRSNTDCFLALADQPVPSPVGEGALIRFLADSQGCIFWYLFIPKGQCDHAVVSSPVFYGPESELENLGDEKDPLQIVFCEESFEAFMCRFWIENEIWYSEYDDVPLGEIERLYLEAYRTAPPDPLRG